MNQFRVEKSSRINAFCVTNDDYSVVLKKENEADMVCNMINRMLKGLDVIDKRFYYNTFYHADDMSRVLEYEIIDRQSFPNYPNHDEQKDIPEWCIYIGENDSGWQDMLVDLLNQLNEENEHLKKELQALRREDIKDKVAKRDYTSRGMYDK